ncbi:MAG: FkbM family methyltransferase [bacterium]
MSVLTRLGSVSMCFPESRLKTYARRIGYRLMRGLRSSSRTITFNNVTLKMYDYPLLGGTGFEEPALSGYIKHRDVQPGDIVVDVGAYAGDFTIYAAIKAGPSGKVIAFEPDSNSHAMLCENIRLNSLSNVTILKKGLWSEDGELSITGTAFASQLSPDSIKYPTRVQVCSLDNELKRLAINRVDFIKVDIEGAEMDALKGMSHTMESKPYLAIASYHLKDGARTSTLLEPILRGKGYRVATENPVHLTTFGLR